MLKSYLNAKTLAVAAAVGIGAIVIYPELLRYLPLLLIAACPLSMLLMGHGGHAGHASHASAGAAGPGQYACPMHPDVRSDSPGRCPRCGMALVPATSAADGSELDSAVPRPGDELGRLTQEFHRLNERQAGLAEQIERLREREGRSTSSRALDEAEEVARTAARRTGSGEDAK